MSPGHSSLQENKKQTNIINKQHEFYKLKVKNQILINTSLLDQNLKK